MDFTAALLAGGRSSRMGRDKAFLEIDDLPLWQRQLQILQALEPSEILIAGPARPEWMDRDLEIVTDAAEDCGPLGGLVAALRRCKSARLLILAIDLPKMTSAFFEELLSHCPDNGGVVPKSNDRFEALAAVYPARCLPLAESCLNSGEHSLQNFVRRAIKAEMMITREIAAAEEPIFLNLNTPADFASIEKK